MPAASPDTRISRAFPARHSSIATSSRPRRYAIGAPSGPTFAPGTITTGTAGAVAGSNLCPDDIIHSRTFAPTTTNTSPATSAMPDSSTLHTRRRRTAALPDCPPRDS